MGKLMTGGVTDIRSGVATNEGGHRTGGMIDDRRGGTSRDADGMGPKKPDRRQAATSGKGTAGR